MKNLKRILIIAVLLLLAGTLTAFAADDTVAPVFDPNIQTMYLLQRKDDGTTFFPENYIRDIKATDDVDGSDVTINLAHNSVDLSQDGQYQLIYTATDKSGNSSSFLIVVLVDGMGPTFNENEETTYYINKEGTIFDSNHNIVEALPETITAKDSMGAYNGIGVYITSDENGNIIFIDTIENTPSVGLLLPNDILIGIDGEDVHGKTPDYAASKIKGDKTDSVLLTIIRNGQEMNVTVPKAIIKLYPEEEFVATPNIEIESINKEEPATIEITYTATDTAGNTTEFVVTVIIMDEVEDETDKVLEDEEDEESEELEDITTSGNPPEDINLELPEEEIVVEESENETVENDEDIVIESNVENTDEIKDVKVENEDMIIEE